MSSYDVLGNIAIIKGGGKTKREKLEEAKRILAERPSVKTVVEKATKVRGRLRTIKTIHILGERNLIAEYKENGCIFRFNIEACYFSPRLANERKEICDRIKSKHKVLVMFAGVGVYPIVIYKAKKPSKIIGVEIGRECCKYFKENLKLNKIPEGKIEVIQGDVKKKITPDFEKFDVVLMPRPNLKDSFLEQGLIASKKNTLLIYYGFCKDEKLDSLIEGLIEEGKVLGRRLRLINVKKAGEIAPYAHRYRIEFKVMN